MNNTYRRASLIYTEESLCLVAPSCEVASESTENETSRETSQSAKTDDSSTDRKPKCISSKTWERFQTLQKRTDNVTRRSTEKRIKHLQKQIMETVNEKMCTVEEKDILRKHDVKLGPSVNERPLSKDGDSSQTQKHADTSVDCSTSSSVDGWKEVQQYLGVNDHLRQEGASSHRPKSGLEKQVNTAILSGDIHTAEALSDRLATRDFGVKIAEAVAAKNFIKRKKEEEAYLDSKKRKKLNWGFEHKKRWETKGNM